MGTRQFLTARKIHSCIIIMRVKLGEESGTRLIQTLPILVLKLVFGRVNLNS